MCSLPTSQGVLACKGACARGDLRKVRPPDSQFAYAAYFTQAQLASIRAQGPRNLLPQGRLSLYIFCAHHESGRTRIFKSRTKRLVAKHTAAHDGPGELQMQLRNHTMCAKPGSSFQLFHFGRSCFAGQTASSPPCH